MADCVIVRAYGRQLDQLRAEAFRIARGRQIDWWIDRGDKGTHFCFESSEAKQAFTSMCDNFAVPYVEA
ncbi:hypothetical protein [Bradyrhizobium sp. LA2.1]|uniref:hypothetical protein n=1 Tax=Bradyrhizobium sp. LA2.1 TaxID=3156376 RepID=UPI00339B46A4